MFKQRCKISALTAAALVSLGLPASPALALVLGSMNVQSRLGEPLRAEVPIPQLSTDEAETLSVDVAPPAVFLAQGLEYSAIASHVRITVQRREDGSAVLNVRSTQPVNEPFFDLILDASWAGGNLRRNYTMLLSPPVLRQAPPPEEIIPAQVQPPADASTAPVADAGSGGTLDFTQGSQGQSSAPTAPAVRGGPARSGQAGQADAGSAGDSVQVRRGDTAGRIAAANLPAGVSLEQMLVALLQANPDAFIRGNVNLVRAGSVLTLPDAQTAQNTPQPEARRLLAAQTRDFNQYRRQLASAAPPAPAAPPPGGSAAGSIATLEPTITTPPAPPDQLILGAGNSAHTGTGIAAKTAEQLQREEEERRLRELQDNLNQIGQIAAIAPGTQGTADTTTPADSTPDNNAATGGATPDSGPVAVITNPAAGEGDAPQAEDSAQPAQQAPESGAADTATAADAEDDSAAQTAPQQYQPPSDPGLLDTLLEDPMIPLAAGGLLVLLLGYGGWRVVQRRRAASEETVFGDSNLDDESLYDDGGQQINTDANTEQDGGNTSSLFYSPSQLDAGDVDPIAEADVYLAYGRDQQAEEILREALRADHARPGLHLKLAEIYAKRADKKAFENSAKTLRDLTQGKGADWEALLALGRTLDPENALYQGGAGKAAPAPAAPAAAAAQPPSAKLEDGVSEFFASSHPPAAAGSAESTQFAPPAAAPNAPAPAPAASSLFKGGLPSSLSLDDFLSAPATAPAATAPAAASAAAQKPAAGDDGLHLDLNLDGDSPAPAAAAAADTAPDPLLTKVELAKEFNAIGDGDGARALLEEVLSEAPDGNPAKAQAQRLLAEMK